VTSRALVERMEAFGHRHARYVESMDAGIAAVVAAAKEGDAILTLGAGSVWQAGEKILEALK
jgi:UDP-N-acetylmuramate--alanine ligase